MISMPLSFGTQGPPKYLKGISKQLYLLSVTDDVIWVIYYVIRDFRDPDLWQLIHWQRHIFQILLMYKSWVNSHQLGPFFFFLHDPFKELQVRLVKFIFTENSRKGTKFWTTFIKKLQYFRTFPLWYYDESVFVFS